MGITSFIFIFLSLLSAFVYYKLKQEYKVLLLAVLSCLLIASYSYYLVLYVIFYSFINFYIGKTITISKSRKTFFILGVVFNITQLILLKYISFTITPLFQALSVDFDLSVVAKIIVPVGVSFFTLQGIGYLININLGWEKPEKSYVHFLVYIAFFPRFLSGPIDRSNHFLPQLKNLQSISEQNIFIGLKLVLFGLFKKVVIADRLAMAVVTAYSDTSAAGSALFVIMLIQPLYLYFDFSGYTNIAFGIARFFGIELRPNFNRPFVSENMSGFWKRFHISLSSWFQDYVFMRTIFKARKWSKNATTYALFFTWILFGIWHGAGWNFMFLGLLQAIAIYYEFVTKKWRTALFSKLPSLYSRWIGRLLTYLFYSISLVFFYAPDLHASFSFFAYLFQGGSLIPLGIQTVRFVVILAVAVTIVVFEAVETDYSAYSLSHE